MTASARQRIAILTATPLTTNPRALKEAAALAAVGYAVTVLGASPDPQTHAVNMKLATQGGFEFQAVNGCFDLRGRLRGQLRRVRLKLANEIFRLFGIASHWQLGPLVLALYRAARRARADLYIAHMEPALWVGTRLMAHGHRVGVDMEDWYSQDLLPVLRKQRPLDLLAEGERALLRNAVHATSTSTAMSVALAAAYDCPLPLVCYNAFPWSDRQAIDGLSLDRRGSAKPSLHWFSQTLGPGRGLEDLFAALSFVRSDFEIHLRGVPTAGCADWIAQSVPQAWKGKVFVHPLVSQAELLSRIAEHDIGFAAEVPFCASRDVTVTNKILHYLLGGLAVVASDTRGQKEIAQDAGGAVLLYPSGSATVLAERIDSLLGDPAQLAAVRAAALQAAHASYSWEMQEPALLRSIEAALAGSRP